MVWLNNIGGRKQFEDEFLRIENFSRKELENLRDEYTQLLKEINIQIQLKDYYLIQNKLNAVKLKLVFVVE